MIKSASKTQKILYVVLQLQFIKQFLLKQFFEQYFFHIRSFAHETLKLYKIQILIGQRGEDDKRFIFITIPTQSDEAMKIKAKKLQLNLIESILSATNLGFKTSEVKYNFLFSDNRFSFIKKFWAKNLKRKNKNQSKSLSRNNCNNSNMMTK